MESLVMDRKTMKSLVNENRIKIIKLLASRKYTTSELATLLETTKSNIAEHLKNLEETGLVSQIDEGRKWKYYILTKKGEEIINKNSLAKPIVLLIASSIFAIAGSLMLLFLMSIGTQPASDDHEYSGIFSPGIPITLMIGMVILILIALTIMIWSVREIIKRKMIKDLVN